MSNPVEFSIETIESVCKTLENRANPIAERFRALFTLKNIGGPVAIDSISRCFNDQSALLKHELAYCLGQMQNEYANKILVEVLKDVNQEPMVRHEAGEALGAIGSESSLGVLENYANDPVKEVAETCQLAIERIRWLHSQQNGTSSISNSCGYTSVDPAPPSAQKDVSELRNTLLDETASMFARYRAMFALRNDGSTEAVVALAEGLKCSSALFRHEIAYVLGQMQHPEAVNQLTVNLQDSSENAMVRHECAEALGSIATDECIDVLQKFSRDSETVVRQSCEVALDMSEYERSDQFEYADGLQKLAKKMLT